MLTKAILTGGVLSALAGCIVYFGTAGADALEGKNKADIRIEETKLAGGAPELASTAIDVAETSIKDSGDVFEDAAESGEDLAGSEDEVLDSSKDEMESNTSGLRGSEVETLEEETVATEEIVASEEPVAEDADVEAMAELKEDPIQDQPKEKSKPETKWLDQYLKRTKPNADSKHEKKLAAKKAEMKKKSDAMKAEMREKAEGMEAKAEAMKAEMKMKADAMEAKLETAEDETSTKLEMMDDKADAMRKPHGDRKMRKRLRIRKHIADGKTDVTAEMSKDGDSEKREVEIDVDAIDVDALSRGDDIDVQALKEKLGLDGEKNVEIRVIKTMEGKPSHSDKEMHSSSSFDYAAVLAEAKKLHVVDMRNQAVLEIVDFAVDNLDMAEAADLVPELSTPELRDTARARIGAGLARCGKAEAAFAIIDELEIDELAAPIRLEIITALMATSQERQAAGIRNKRRHHAH